MESQMHVFHVALCYHNEVVLDAVFLCPNYSITSLTGVYSWVFSLVFQPSKLLLLRIMSIVDIFKATRSPQALNKYLFISVPHIFGPLTTIQVIAFASLRTENCCLFHLFHVLFPSLACFWWDEVTVLTTPLLPPPFFPSSSIIFSLPPLFLPVTPTFPSWFTSCSSIHS